MVENEQLRMLRFSETDADGKSLKWVEKPVEPLTDGMIVRLPFDERVAKVREIAVGRFGKLVESEAAAAGEEHLQPGSLLLACVMQDRDLRAGEVSYLTRKFSSAEQQHREALEGIRTRQKGGRLKQEEQIENQRWQRQRDQMVTEIQAEEGMERGLAEVVLNEYFLRTGGLEALNMAVEDLRDLGMLDQDSLQALMAGVQRRVESVSASELIHFGYKPGVDNLRSAEQARVLKDLLMAGLGEQRDDPVYERQRLIASGLLTKYEKNPKALYGVEEQTPLLAWVHDCLYAAALTNNEEMFRLVAERVMGLVNRNRQIFGQELGGTVALVQEEMRSCLREIKEQQERLGIEQLGDERLLSQFDPSNAKHPYWVGTHYDRLASLHTAFAVLTQELGLPSNIYLTERNRIGERLGRQVGAGKPHLAGLITDETPFVVWRSLLSNHFSRSWTLDAMLSARFLTKTDYVQRKERLVSGFGDVHYGDPDYHQRMIQAIQQSPNVSERSRIILMAEAHLARIMLPQPDVSLGELRSLSQANQERLREVFRRNFGGVAGGGDWYRAGRDGELASMGVDAVGLLPATLDERVEVYGDVGEAGVRQAFKVRLNLNGGDQIELRLADDGRLLLGAGIELRVPIWMREPLMKLVLDRLAFSTRRVAEVGVGGRHETSFDELVRPSETFRWRHLQNPPYNLRSKAARDHAAEVLADPRYGFDIDATNLLWRAKGWIGHDEVVTYVRPSEEAANRPREMTFNPDELGMD